MKKFVSKIKLEHIVLAVIFAIVLIASKNIQITEIADTKTRFTAFDSLAPMIGAFTGSIVGSITLLSINIGQFINNGADFGLAINWIRIITPIFALLYFANGKKFNLVFTAIAIIAFLAHPIGRQAAEYTLLWTVPFVAYFFKKDSSFFRSLGATFTQHAVGGALFIWTMPTTPAFWTALIPVVILERTVIAAGMTVSYEFAKKLITNLKEMNLEMVKERLHL